ncbi:MAG: GNAT family N-acetyltransferase [Alicyclobacillus sp.]|nr:GNAT family N-acetyltransferase [Alicyclobacillus sp.]
MPSRRSRRAVTGGSIAIALVSAALEVYFREAGRAAPLWDSVALAYGSVFCAFLALDSFSRRASRMREAERQRSRPRPLPAPGTGRQVVLPGSGEPASGVPRVPAATGDAAWDAAAASGDLAARNAQGDARGLDRAVSGQALVRLDPAAPGDVEWLQALLDEAVTELAALEGVRPATDADGHVTAARASEWLTDPAMRVYFLAVNDPGERESAERARVGCCAVRMSGRVCEIALVYVRPGWRRRGAGRAAVAQLVEFVRLLGGIEEVRVPAPAHNARARRFWRSAGFAPPKPPAAGTLRDSGGAPGSGGAAGSGGPKHASAQAEPCGLQGASPAVGAGGPEPARPAEWWRLQLSPGG